MSRRTFFFLPILFLCVLLISASAIIHYENLRRLPDGITIGMIQLKGMRRDQASVLISTELNRFRKMKFRIMKGNDEGKIFFPEELGINFDVNATINQIFRDTGWFTNLFSESANAFDRNSYQYKPVIRINKSFMRKLLEKYLLADERDYHDAEIFWSDKNWQLKKSQSGILLGKGELDRIQKEIISLSSYYQVEHRIQVAYENIDPMVKTGELRPLLQDIKRLVDEPFTINFLGESTKIRMNEDPRWIELNQKQRTVHLNREYAKQVLSGYIRSQEIPSGQIKIMSVAESLSEYDGMPVKRAVMEGDFRKGKRIKEDIIIKAFFDSFSHPSQGRIIEAEWEEIEPRVISYVPGYEFPQLLSTGISSFRYGNYPNRVKNIKLSLAAFRGVIVDSGEEVSFNRITGWITPQKGYTETKIISGGRVEKGIGGGVCQSSTTVYRSILNAGMPLTERKNHSLDILYYHEYGYGLDASVYTDSHSDLKFVNDFPGPVFINAYTDDENNLAFVEFYGTTDERVVELKDIPTGNSLIKHWEQKITWPGRSEIRTIESHYQEPLEIKENEGINPLEA